MTHQRVLGWLLASLTVIAFAESKSHAGASPTPPPPPEVKRTLDAVVGRWSGNMTAIVPGSPPATFGWSIDCQPAALQAGAICAMEGHAPISVVTLPDASEMSFEFEGRKQ